MKILLFDGVCNLCNGIVKFIIRHDRRGKFKFAALQSSSGAAVLARFDLCASDFDSLVFVSNGRYYLRSTAVLHVLWELGGLWKLFFMLIIIPRPLRDFLYTRVAKSRYQLWGRKNECMIPTPELKNRFL